MPSSKAKPTASVRPRASARATTAAAAAPSHPPPLTAEESRKLDAAGAKHERAPEDQASTVRTGRGIVTQPGRPLANGERKRARQARRVTLYLDLSVADELVIRAHRAGRSLSDEVAARLAESYGVSVAG